MKQGLVSVIVPVYNSANYIGRCIESILNQTYDNIELLLIDDGSKDDSYLLCLKYAHNSRKITVIHQDNAGVGNARNKGIKLSSGEFIIFVDSDDTIEKNHIYNLMYAHKECGTLILCGYNNIYKDYVNSNSIGNGELLKSNFETLIDKWMLDPVVGSPCNKLIEASVIHNNKIKFPENINYAEDFIFSIKLFDCFEKIVLLDNCSYNYFMETPESLSKVNFINTKEWWAAQKFVFDELKTCKFLKNSLVPQKVFCYMLTLNYIQQLKIDNTVSESFISDINSFDCYKKSLRNIECFTASKQIVIFYKIMRLRLLIDATFPKKCLSQILRLMVKIHSFIKNGTIYSN